MIYLTGDTHGDFERIFAFCQRFETSRDDIMIILGDVGLNFYGGYTDKEKKARLAKNLPITLFCIHGNHEKRPFTIPSYKEKLWHGGTVYHEESYPNLLFAKDGEIFDLEDTQTVVIGGAYCVDKQYRLTDGYGWWDYEQPSAEI